jgi:hypothetical protein
MKQGSLTATLFIFCPNALQYVNFHTYMFPENQRRERFTAYAHMLKEQFHSGILAELQPLRELPQII